MEDIITYAIKHRSAVVIESEKLDILLLHAEMRYEHHRQISCTHPGRRPPASRGVERICQLLHRKKDIVQALTAAPPPGNYVAKSALVPRVTMVAAYVQQFVRERRAIRQRTVARDVMDELARHYVIYVDYDSILDTNEERYNRKLDYSLREDYSRKRDIYFEYFENRMKNLLDVLDVHNIKNTIVMLGNAKYRYRLPTGAPKDTSKKTEMLIKCKEWGISADTKELQKAIWAKLKKYVQTKINPEIVEVAETELIETVWAIVKGEVGRLYSSETSFAEVNARLAAAFDNLKPSTVQGCIRKANHTLEDIYKVVFQAEDNDEDSDGNAESDID
ncbi:hypothetical protein GN958_ATG05247, partial [Phytophthora infestans]